jgi:hypothetical protein
MKKTRLNKKIAQLLQKSSEEYEAEFDKFRKIGVRIGDLLTCMDMWIVQFHNELCEDCMRSEGKGIVFVPEGKETVFADSLKARSDDLRRLNAAAETFFASFQQMWPCEGSNPAPMHMTKKSRVEVENPSNRPPPA